MREGVCIYTLFFNKLPSYFLLPLLSTALVHQRDAHQIIRGLTFTEAFLGKKFAHIPGNFFIYVTSENQSKPVPLWIFGKCQLEEINSLKKSRFLKWRLFLSPIHTWLTVNYDFLTWMAPTGL